MGKNPNPINSAPSNSKTEVTLLQIDRQTQREDIKLEKHLFHRGSKVPKLEFVNRLRCFSKRCEISFSISKFSILSTKFKILTLTNIHN